MQSLFTRPLSVSSAAGLALIFFIYVLFLRGCKIGYCVAKIHTNNT